MWITVRFRHMSNPFRKKLSLSSHPFLPVRSNYTARWRAYPFWQYCRAQQEVESTNGDHLTSICFQILAAAMVIKWFHQQPVILLKCHTDLQLVFALGNHHYPNRTKMLHIFPSTHQRNEFATQRLYFKDKITLPKCVILNLYFKCPLQSEHRSIAVLNSTPSVNSIKRIGHL